MGIEACTRHSIACDQPKGEVVRTAQARALSFQRKPESKTKCAWRLSALGLVKSVVPRHLFSSL